MKFAKQLLVVGLLALSFNSSLYAVVVGTEAALISEINLGTLLIELSADITLTKALPPINTSGMTIRSDTPGVKRVIDMDNKGRGLVVFNSITGVTLKDLSLENGLALAGDGGNPGGGGGCGAGGALFLGKDSSTVVENVDFISNSAVGGAGGVGDLSATTRGGGGGGGIGGDGGEGGRLEILSEPTPFRMTGGGGGGFAAGGAGGGAAQAVPPGPSFVVGSTGGAAGLDGPAGVSVPAPDGPGVVGAGGLGQDSKLGVVGTPGAPSGDFGGMGGPRDPGGAISSGGDNSGGGGGGGAGDSASIFFVQSGGGGGGGGVGAALLGFSSQGNDEGGIGGRYGGGGGGGSAYVGGFGRSGGDGGPYGGGGAASISSASFFGGRTGICGGGGSGPFPGDDNRMIGGDGGDSMATTKAPGGGGGAIGGAILVDDGASLIFRDSSMAASQSLTAGAAGVGPGTFTTAPTAGTTRGEGFFLFIGTTLTIDVTAGSQSIFDAIADDGIAEDPNTFPPSVGGAGVTKTGVGTLIYPIAQNYIGTTTVSGGDLDLSVTGTIKGAVSIGAAGTVDCLAVNALSTTSAATVDGILNLTGFSQEVDSLSGSGTINLGAGTLTISGSSPTTLSQTYTGTGGVTYFGNSLLTVTSAPGFTGPLTVTAGLTRLDAVLTNSLVMNAPVFLNVGAATYPGDISGTGDMTRFGSGTTTTFTGTNTSTGSLILNEGNARGAAAAFPDSIVTMLDTTASAQTKVIFDVAVAETYSGVVSGTGDIEKIGAGTLTLGANQAHIGNTLVSAGLIAIDAQQKLGPAALALSGGGLQTTASFVTDKDFTVTGASPIVVDGGTIFTITSDITDGTGSGGIIKRGAGLLAFTADSVNTGATGTTEIEAGTLQIIQESNLTAGSVDINSGGTLRISTTFPFTKTVTLSSGTGNILVDPGQTLNASGVFSGPGLLRFSGDGFVNLSAVNTHTGGTEVAAGLLTVTADSQLGGAAGNLNISNNAAVVIASTLSTARDSILSAGGTLAINGGVTFTHTGAISGTGPLVKQGSGRLILGGTSTYTGGTSLIGGLLEVSADANLGAASGNIDISNNAALVASGTFTTARDSVLSSGGVISVLSGFDFTHNGIISGTSDLTKVGPGTLKLGGVNTFVGDLNISQGDLQASSDANFGNAANVININNNAALIACGSFTTTRSTVITSGGILGATSGITLTHNGVISGSGPLTINDNGTVVLGGANTFTGNLVVNDGLLRLSSDGNFGAGANSLILQNGGAFSPIGSFSNGRAISLLSGGGSIDVPGGNTFTHTGNITGSGALTKSSTGTLILDGTNSYTGGTTVGAGILQGDTDALQGAISIGGAGSLIFDQAFNGTYAGALSGTGNLVKNGTGTVALTGSSPGFTGPISINEGAFSVTAGTNLGSASELIFNGGNLATSGSPTISIPAKINGSTSAFDVTSGSLTYSGVISDGTSTGTLTKIGSGTLTLTASNTHSAGNVITAGTLQVSSNANLGGPTSTVSIAGGATLEATASFTTSRTFIIGPGIANISVTPASSTLTHTGTITGPGSLNKTGPGTLDITGAILSYLGDTNVDDGTLIYGASVPGDLTNDTGGCLSPGPGIATLTIPGSFTNTGTIKIDVDKANLPTADLIKVTGAVSIAAGSKLEVTNIGVPLIVAGDIFTFIDHGGINATADDILNAAGIPMVGCFQPVVIDPASTPGFLRFRMDAMTMGDLPTLTGNAEIIANFFDTTNIPGQLQTIEDILLNTPIDELPDKVNQLHPGQFADTNFLLHRQGDTLGRTLFKHLSQMQLYNRGNKRSTFWAQPSAILRSQDTKGLQIGYDAESASIFLASDFHMSDNFLIGVGFGYTHTDIDWRKINSEAEMDSLLGTIYSMYKDDYLFGELAILVADNKDDAHRNISIEQGGTSFIARVDHKAPSNLIAAHAGGGFTVNSTPLILNTYGLFNISRVRQHRYDEIGAGAANVQVDGYVNDEIAIELGFECAYDFISDLYDIIITPKARASYIGTFPIGGNRIDAVISGDPDRNQLDFFTRDEDQHYFAPGVECMIRGITEGAVKGGYLNFFYNLELQAKSIAHELGLRGAIFF